MPACEVTIHEIPVSLSSPNSDDLVMFTLDDGTTVMRYWSNILNGSVPDDEEYVVAASGGTINNGDDYFILPTFVNKRVRVYRNGVKQGTTAVAGGSYYSFDPATARFDVVPAASTDDLFQIESY